MTVTEARPEHAAASQTRSLPGRGVHRTGSDVVLLGALALACAAVAAVVAMRGRSETAGVADASSAERSENLPAKIVAAATSAGTALDATHGEPRQVVIAAYAAMVATLTAANPRVRATDTPGRVLDRAAAEGVVDVLAARALIGLFEHARFSTHPVTSQHVAAAGEALVRVRTSAGAFAGVG